MTSKGCPLLARAHGNRDGDALDAQIRKLVLPVETSAGKRRVRQPGERDVVEDVVPREPFGLSGKHALEEFVAACVVVEQISREADG